MGRNLRALRAAIHDESYITYFEEKRQDIDRVLEIFIRTNDGGTQLQKSDLLLSIAQANWDEYDAREELTSFVDHLNTQLPEPNDYDKDFLLKSCLVLSGLPVQYRVANFKRENVSKIEDQWPSIKRSIEQAATLVNHFGIDENTLTSRNAVIPVAYYFKKSGVTAEELTREDSEYFEIKQQIKKWFISSLLHGTLTGSADAVLTRIRNVLDEEEGVSFPNDRINSQLRSLNKMVGFNEEIADNILEYEKGGRRTFLALSLLYDKKDWGNVQHHQDHIFPASKLKVDNFVEQGIPADKAQDFEDRADKLANLQLLTGMENQAKQDTPFDQWVKDRADSFYTRHLIPNDTEYYKIENFDKFLDRRGEMIKRHLLSVLED